MKERTELYKTTTSPIIRITRYSMEQQDSKESEGAAEQSGDARTENMDCAKEPDKGSPGSAGENNNKNTNVKEKVRNDQVATISDTNGSPMRIAGEETHAYKRRFLILALFCSHSAINSFQWIQYSSITNIIADYYGASNMQVNLTSEIYMITYIPFIIHASLMLERVGLRKAILLGTLGTALGSMIKWYLGGQPGMTAFWYMMGGQTIVALSQLYIISIPPLLAAVWFPDDQVSTATGIGVFGNQLGIALGFILPPLVISDLNAGKEIIGRDLDFLAGCVSSISFAICLITILTLEDKPPKPPGSASLHAEHSHLQEVVASGHEKIPALASIKELCRDADFRYLIFSYGINVGVFYAISTVLNQMVFIKWKDMVDLAGRMGLLIVVSGMVGSVVCGQLLDRTHAYKLIIVLIYLFSLLSMLVFALVIEVFSIVWPLYLVSITLGFFMTGYLPLGFEFAAEITYPHPANTPAGLLNLSAQVFGLILTHVSSMMVDELGNVWANTFLSGCLTVGLALTVLMKAKLKRQRAVAEEQMKF